MEDESDTSGKVNVNVFGDSVERIKNDYGALRCIFSKMEFGDLLQARLVCREWKKESDFFIRRRIKRVDLTTDCRLKEYLKSDRTVYPFINLDVGGLSTKVLAKCDLKGVQELFTKTTTGPKRDGRVIRASNIWLGYLKNKFLKLFQQENNLTSLHLHLRYPVTFTREESDFVNNFANIRYLSFKLSRKSDIKNFEGNSIGSILVSRCPSVQYLTMKLGNSNYMLWEDHPIIKHLLNILNERMEYGHPMPILSIQPRIRVGPKNFERFVQFFRLSLRFEILELSIECRNEHQFNEIIRVLEKLLQNTADFLRELHLDFWQVEGINSQPRITIPFLPKLQNLEIGAKIKGVDAYQFIRLPDNFPCLKKLQFLSNWNVFFISGKVFPNLDELRIGSFNFFYIPDSPPVFPNLQTIDLQCHVRQEFLRFAFTHLTSVREMRIVLPFNEEYFDAWNIFTGGAQPPAYVLPALNNRNRGQVTGNAEVNVNYGNPVLVEPKHLVASLQNFTNLRELVISFAVPRDIQAITYMTQFNKMENLDKLRIYTFNTDFDDFCRCLDILQGYHCDVEIR